MASPSTFHIGSGLVGCLCRSLIHFKMTFRLVQKQSMADVQETEYLFFFEDENKYSMASRKLVICEDSELKVGAKLKVKSGLKNYLGILMNVGPREDLEAILAVYEKNTKSPALPNDDNDIEMLGDDETPKAVPLRKKKRTRETCAQKEESSASDSDDPEIRKERKKVTCLLSDLANSKPISDLTFSDPLPESRRVKDEEKEIRELRAEMSELKKTVERLCGLFKGSQAGGASPSGMVRPRQVNGSGGSCSVESSPSQVKTESEEESTKMVYNGVDLMNLPAPPKDMAKYAIRVLRVLFSNDELRNGIVFQSSRSKRIPLDPRRVDILFDALRAKYGKEKVSKGHQAVVDSCNQKCRDILREDRKGPNPER